MRKIKLMSIIMTILSCVSIFSVGFSSWFGFEPQTKLKLGTYNSYGVLAINNVEMSVFQFSAFSFKNENYENSDEGVISIKYQIPKESLRTLDEQFTISLTLGYTEIFDDAHKLFKNAFVTNEGTNDCTVYIDGVRVGGAECITDNDEIYFEHTFSNTDKNKEFLEFTVTYVFEIPSENNNFRKTFGKYLIGSEKEGANATMFTAEAEYILDN